MLYRHTLKQLFPYVGCLSRSIRQNHIEIGGRRYLPGSNGLQFPKYLQEARQGFPKILSPDDSSSSDRDAPGWSTKFYEDLEQCVDKYNAVVLRGFPIDNVHDFSTFVSGISAKPLGYKAGAAFRNSVAENVFTASNEPAVLNLEPHNEMSYKEEWPKWVDIMAMRNAKKYRYQISLIYKIAIAYQWSL